MKHFFILYTLSTVLLFSNENKLLFYGNCIACHGELGKPSAPNLHEVKGYYLLAYPEKEAFVKNMAEWINNPNKKKSKLPEAVKKYNLMPYLAIDLDTLTKIATYIYENNDFGVADSF